MSPAAVLFDLDGTLIDCEPAWERVAKKVVTAHGGVLTSADQEKMLGADLDDTITIIANAIPRPVRRRALRRQLIRDVARHYAHSVPWMPGALDTLTTVRASTIPTACVTNTIRSIAEHAFDAIGRDWFDVVVCGDEVPAGKPAPDPYLRAAQLLGVDIRDCLVLEDSSVGIEAAQTAGATVLIVTREGITGAAADELLSARQC